MVKGHYKVVYARGRGFLHHTHLLLEVHDDISAFNRHGQARWNTNLSEVNVEDKRVKFVEFKGDFGKNVMPRRVTTEHVHAYGQEVKVKEITCSVDQLRTDHLSRNAATPTI